MDPASPTSVLSPLPSSFNTSYMTCPSSEVCVLIGGGGSEVTFDPTTGTATSPIRIDQAPPGRPGNPVYIGSPSCPSVTACTVFDTAGGVVTFDPATGTATSRDVIDGAGGGVNWLDCPSTTQCTLVNTDGAEVTFNPTAPSDARRVLIDPSGYILVADACPSVTQCTLIDSLDAEQTFNPQNPSTATPYLAHTGIDGVTSYRVHPHFAPLIAFDLLAGTLAPADAIGGAVVPAPPGMRFVAAGRALHLVVHANGVPARYRATLRRGALVIALAHTSYDLRVRISGPGLALSRTLNRRLVRQQTSALPLRVRARTANGTTRALAVTVPFQHPYAWLCAGHTPAAQPITTSQPFDCID